MNNLSLIRWAGGKGRQLKDLLPLIPQSRIYVEPFAGGISVLLNKQRSEIEVINDLDGALVNLFEIVRGDDTFDEFRRLLDYTPYSRAEFEACLSFDGLADPVRRAVAFYTVINQSISGKRLAGKADWARGRMDNLAERWFQRHEKLGLIHERIKHVQIECRDALDILQEWDTEDTTFYCLHPDTPIRLANESQVSISDITPGLLLSNGETVESVAGRWHKGPLLSIRIQGVLHPILVTPEHRIGIHNGFTEARNLSVGDKVAIPLEGQYQEDDRKDEFFRLLGYYAAEGHMQRTKGKPYMAILSFGTHEIDTWVEDAADCCEITFGLRPKIRSGPVATVTQVKIGSTSISTLISRLVPGTAYTKQLDEEIMTAPPTLQREVLIGWLRGDGTLSMASRNRVKLCGSTVSKILAEQMYAIALRNGLKPSMKFRGGKCYDVYFASEDALKLGWPVHTNTSRSTRPIIDSEILTRVRAIEEVQYNGPVYDIHTSGPTHSFSANWVRVHNCDPPYILDTRAQNKYYAVEPGDDYHNQLVDVLLTVKGCVVLSGYDHPIYLKLLDEGWWTDTYGAKAAMEVTQQGSTKQKRVEIVYRNRPATIAGVRVPLWADHHEEYFRTTANQESS